MTVFRRKVIRPPRGPFMFPGTKPGYDPGHIAASPQTRYSGVAFNGGFVNILNGTQGAPATNNQPTSRAVSPLGNCLIFPATGGDSAYGVNGDTSDILTFTMAGIAQITATTGLSLTLFHNAQTTAGNIGIVFQVTSTGFVNLAALGGTSVVSTIQPSVGVPYFLAASNGGASNICNMIGVNLLTGKAETYTSTGITTDNAPSGAGFTIGNRATGVSGANSWSGLVASIAFTNKFMSLPALSAWGSDPWSFWYPRK